MTQTDAFPSSSRATTSVPTGQQCRRRCGSFSLPAAAAPLLGGRRRTRARHLSALPRLCCKDAALVMAIADGRDHARSDAHRRRTAPALVDVAMILGGVFLGVGGRTRVAGRASTTASPRPRAGSVKATVAVVAKLQPHVPPGEHCCRGVVRFDYWARRSHTLAIQDPRLCFELKTSGGPSSGKVTSRPARTRSTARSAPTRPGHARHPHCHEVSSERLARANWILAGIRSSWSCSSAPDDRRGQR